MNKKSAAWKAIPKRRFFVRSFACRTKRRLPKPYKSARGSPNLELRLKNGKSLYFLQTTISFIQAR
ncbi:hypothetical protein [Anaerotruncus sp.]|uniref:hypothetical protein n=1 Tax=Anaerotruncus sp. TaxID=1872531 RepID=UPI0025B830B2|nr:hypothetical protein [Anaerotruncus sp.]